MPPTSWPQWVRRARARAAAYICCLLASVCALGGGCERARSRIPYLLLCTPQQLCHRQTKLFLSRHLIISDLILPILSCLHASVEAVGGPALWSVHSVVYVLCSVQMRDVLWLACVRAFEPHGHHHGPRHGYGRFALLDSDKRVRSERCVYCTSWQMGRQWDTALPLPTAIFPCAGEMAGAAMVP